MSAVSLAANLPTLIALIGGSAGLGGLFMKWLGHKRAKRKQTDEVALSLVDTLQHRVEAVETLAAQKDALCEAQLAVLRHRVNNLAGNFDGLVMVLDLAPDKAAEVVARIKERRASQEQAEAIEKAAIQTALIQAAGNRGSGSHAPADPPNPSKLEKPT